MTGKVSQTITIGLDIGIASVGWAVLLPDRILALGVRAFDRAENEKGEPLNLARRMNRTARTRLERRVLRLKRLRRVLHTAGLAASSDPIAFATPSRSRFDPPNDPWHLRAEALDRKLTPNEWARVLYHLVKHRGFYAARRSEMTEPAETKSEKAKEKLGLLAGVTRTEQLLSTGGYRTLGELAAKNEAFAQAKRNKAGAYTNSFSRKLLREEVEMLFEAQRSHGNPHASADLHAKVDELFWYQKPALSGEAVLRMLGYCTFEKDEYRAAKYSWSAERFVWLTRLNNLRVIHNGERRPLTEAERQAVIDLPYKLNEVKYKQLRTALVKAVGFPEEAGFAGLSYRQDAKKDPEEASLGQCKGWHELRRAFDRAGTGAWPRVSQDHALLDAIATALSIYKTDDELKPKLAGLGLAATEIEELIKIGFSDFIQISLKALGKILPHMEAGERYDEACTKAGYNHSKPVANSTRSKYLPPLFRDEVRQIGKRKKVIRVPILVRNPVVSRALNQARKVLNALIREYGSPIAVHVELSRDMSKSFEERRDIRKGQDVYKERKDAAQKQFIGDIGHEPRGQELMKYLLYREQDAQCAYSQEALDLGRLLEIGYAEIDHILPYSRSYDDSQNNKVLVLARENRDKGDRTPFEYLDGASDSERWRRFEAWVRGHKGLRRAKRERLLRRVFDEREAKEFAERNLNDTRYATRYFAAFVRDNLDFAEGAGEVPVLTPSGGFTSFLRARWGLVKNREESDLHHALDACVVAAASPALIKRVSDYHRQRETLAITGSGRIIDSRTGEILKDAKAHFPEPWDHFGREVEARLKPDPKAAIMAGGFANYDAEAITTLKPVWVSRAPKRRNGGALHQETIRSAKLLDKGLSYVSVKLQDLKLSHLNTTKENGKPNEEIMVGLVDPRNAALVEVLRERLIQHGGDGKKAFAQPVYKPSAPGKQAPPVRTVKILSTQKGGVAVRGGVADQASMWRVDVFEKGGKFYLVPIYQSDRRKGADLPIRAATAAKLRSDWTVIDESFSFCFSLCLNDPVRLTNKDGSFMGYFAGLNVNTASITIATHNRDVSVSKNGVFSSLGVKTAHAFEKFHVDILGNLYPAGPEDRRGLA